MNDHLTPKQALDKIKHYCAYQERCHSEVRSKLYGYGLYKTEVEEILSILITENYLNEERFALHYAGGKFRIKRWGKNKIIRSLKQKQVSDYCINKAIKEIDEAEYQKTFFRLAEKKRDSVKSEKNIFTKKRKIRDYLLYKGFGFDLINEFLKTLDKSPGRQS